jgi:predicted NBD/HSP70 family sugar kinase
LQGKISRNESLRSVAELLLHRGPISRAELSKLSGFSKQTMSEVIGALEADGLVRPIGRTNGNIGRTAVVYDLAADVAYAAGIDLGVTWMSAALVDVMGNIVAQRSIKTDERGGQFVVDQICDVIIDLARGIDADPERVRQVAIGSPGVVDYRTGRIQMSPNVHGLDTVNMRELIANKLGTEVSIENDVNLALVGEHWQGRARGIGNAALVFVSTGVGMGFTANGILIRGISGAAGEIAYMPIGSDLYSPEALSAGALEREIGASGMLRRYEQAAGFKLEAASDIFERRNSGDAAAAKVIDDTAQALAIAIAAICAVVDPQIVILAGSIGSRSEFIEATMRKIPALSERPIRLEASELKERAGLVGALAMALNRLHSVLFGASGTTGSEFQDPAQGKPSVSERIGRNILDQII